MVEPFDSWSLMQTTWSRMFSLDCSFTVFIIHFYDVQHITEILQQGLNSKCSSENSFAVDDNVYIWLGTMGVSHLKIMMCCELVSSGDCVMRYLRWRTEVREMTKLHLCQSVSDFSQRWSFSCGSLWPVFYGVFFSNKAMVYPSDCHNKHLWNLWLK